MRIKTKKIKKRYRNLFLVLNINIFIIMLFVSIGVFYLILINSSTSNGYEIKKINLQISKLKTEAKNLNVSLSYKQSMENILVRVGEMGLVETDKISYISIPSTAVARK